MEKSKQSLLLQCPDHNMPIGMLNVDPNAKKIGYCYECIEESDEDGAVIKALKSVSSYLKDNSSFYEKCRQRVLNTGEPPAEYAEELAKKGERLEKFSKHIDEEKEKVRKSFEEITKDVIQIIEKKEKECLEVLDKEILGLSEAYLKYEKLLMIGWPKLSDIQNIYPEADILKRRMSKIESLDQLRAFMAGVQEDVQVQNLYFKDEYGESRVKKAADGLISCFNMAEFFLPRINSTILKGENMENLMKVLMEGFIKQEVQINNSIAARINELSCASNIISNKQFEILKDWLSKNYNSNFNLLYRGSVDGMSPWKFHNKCDGQGATVTLIKCLFDGAWEFSIIGGFIDQSWNSNQAWGSAKEAFIFSLGEQNNSVRCRICESQYQFAFYGHPQYGPVFGGNDIKVENDFLNGSVTSSNYWDSAVLCGGNGTKFIVQEIEVFQVS